MAEIRKVTEQFSVAPQLVAEDFAEVAAAGFAHILNNRPDGEDMGQLATSDAEAAAQEAGLSYAYEPFQGPPTQESVDALKAVFADAKGPVLAYCRTGTRSVTAWAAYMAQSGGAPVDEILANVRGAGYDLDGLRPALESLAAGK